VPGRTEGEYPFFCAALLLITPGAAKGGIEFVEVERLLQGVGLHHPGMKRGAGVDRIDPARDALLVYMDDQVEAEALGCRVPEADHLTKLPGRVDVKQGKRELCGIEGLDRNMQHHARVFSDRVEHDRLFELGDHVTHDFDRFSFETAQMFRQHVSSTMRDL